MRPGRRLVAASLFAFATAACAPAPHTRGAGAVSPLAVRAVAWSPSSQALPGRVRAVADVGGLVVVFADHGAAVFEDGARVGTWGAVSDWRGAGAIAPRGGAPASVLGVGGDGRVYRLRGRSSFEDVTDRYGLGGARARGAAPLGEGAIAFLLKDGVAIDEGGRVTDYAAPEPGVTFAELSGAGDRGVAITPRGVDVFDVATKAITAYPLAGATHAALGADGRLYATTSRAVYAGNARGDLELVYRAGGDTIHGLAASGSRVWFADGDELGIVRGGDVAESTGAKIDRAATLAPSSSGDVWVLGQGGLARFAGAVGGEPAGDAWTAAIAPIFARACSLCHLADGISGTDLSNARAWSEERAQIRERVVEKRSMPPEGHPLSDADRDVIRRWIEAPAR